MRNERAIECRTCGGTHRTDVPCPPIGRWLISGHPVVQRARQDRITELIERSSLGTPEAKALRDSVSDEVAWSIVARSKEAP